MKPAYELLHVHLIQKLSVDSSSVPLVSSQMYHNSPYKQSVSARVDEEYQWPPTEETGNFEWDITKRFNKHIID